MVMKKIGVFNDIQMGNEIFTIYINKIILIYVERNQSEF